MLLNVFLETDTSHFIQDSQMNRKSKRTAFIWNRHIFNIINVFNITFDQFNAAVMNKTINYLKKSLLMPNIWMELL